EQVLDMVRAVRALDLEACVTLGMLTDAQAEQLRDAGLTAYNHNLDTSRQHYPNIISTRTYDDRLRTLQTVSKAGIAVCCGGLAGANSIFFGEKLLTAPNPDAGADADLFRAMGLPVLAPTAS